VKKEEGGGRSSGRNSNTGIGSSRKIRRCSGRRFDDGGGEEVTSGDTICFSDFLLGSMTFDSTTSRDADALATVLRWGAKQAVIAEYCHQRLTQEQQAFLSKSFQAIQTTKHQGITIGTGR